jgi:hypothetical protein
MNRALFPAIAFVLNASPALADLSAEEVLADHLNLLSLDGHLDMTTTSTTESADGLTVDGFVGSYEDDDTQIEIRTPGMILTEQPDGSVDITYADTLPIAIYADPKDEDPVTVTLNLETKGLRHRVSGDLDDLQHDIAFDALAIGTIEIDPPEAAKELDLVPDIAVAAFSTTINRVNADPVRRSVTLSLKDLRLAMSALAPTDIDLDTRGTTFKTEGIGEMEVLVALSDLTTSVEYIDGDLPRHSMNTTLGSLLWQTSSVIPDDEGGIELDLGAEDLAVSYDVQFDVSSFETDVLKALTAGQMISVAFSFASLDYDFGLDTPEGAFSSSTKSGLSENRFSFSKNGLDIFSSTVDSVFILDGPLMDLPIGQLGYTVAKSLIDLSVPITPSEDVQAFRTRIELEGLATDNAIWDMFDPTAQLPRTPLDLSFDISGSTVVVSDVFAQDGSVPFRGTEADMSDMRLSFAGAEVTGSGNIKDTSTPDKPAGVGELNMTLKGIHKLIDTVVEMGLLPNEQAMGARLGLGLIARPGDDANTLISHIEVNEEGQIFANDQRIK